MTFPFYRTCAALTLTLGSSLTAYPWAAEGHHAMALTATANLSDAARAHVVKILGSDDLSSIAVWMDDVRSAAYHSGPLGSDPEALRFNALFPRNGEWHYVDLPLGVKAYDLNGDYERDDDVVHELEAAIAVLEGTGDKRISPREALCMVVHFVGDLHQPLHVGNGVFATAPDGTAKLVEDPVAAKGLPNDKGGNADFFGPGKYDELHGYWDFELVQKITDSKEPEAVAAVIGKKVSAEGSSWKSAGDYHHWPEAWATESLAAARTAFAGITYGALTPDGKGGIKRIAITLPPHYDDTCVPLATERLAKSAFHLAELLNAIHWAD
jgi:hypothetical protein